jgi:hypothetical protein
MVAYSKAIGILCSPCGIDGQQACCKVVSMRINIKKKVNCHHLAMHGKKPA